MDTSRMLSNERNIHIIKLVVGISDLHEYARHMSSYLVPYKDGMANPVWTRYRPKEFEALQNGGSLYRVIGGRIVCRQEILGFEEAQHPHKGTMCLIMCAPKIIRTVATPKRAFQGWRYLRGQDIPPDVGLYDENEEEAPPAEIAKALSEAGLL